MNIQACVTLGLLAAVLVIPHTVLSQSSSDEATTASPNTGGTTTTANPNACSGQPGGLSGTLGQVGNLLGNLLNDLGPLRALGLTNPNGLLDLVGILEQVQFLLNNLLVGLEIGNLNLTQENGLVANLVNQLTALLNNLLGGNAGDNMRCQTPTSSTGGPLGTIINGLGTLVNGSVSTNNLGLITLVNALLTLVGALLNMLGVPTLVGGLTSGVLPPL